MRIYLSWLLVAAISVILWPWDVQAAQSSAVKAPRKIKDVKPVYPEQSLLAGDEGVVLVELKVDTSGSVTDTRVLWSKCSRLNESALKATRSWQFEQVLVDGKARPFAVTAQVPFRLPEKLSRVPDALGRVDGLIRPKPIS